MNAKDFIEMMYHDIETEKEKKTLTAVVQAMQECLQMVGNPDIDESKKTPQDLYKKMYEHAKNNEKNHAYCFTPNATLTFTQKYLGIDCDTVTQTIDRTASQTTDSTTPQLISIDDFF